MQYAAFIFAIFGLLAYLELSSLKKRIAELERQLSTIQGTRYAAERSSRAAAVQSYIGRRVKLELKEDHEDVDVVMYGNTRHGSNTILDADEDWMLVRIDGPKGVKEKLLRLESIQNVTLVGEDEA